MIKFIRILASHIIFSAFFPHWTFATLGEPEISIEHERIALSNSTVTKESHPQYVVHLIRNKELILREYSNLDGKIFAVSWFGGVPDLKSLLGNQFAPFEEARKTAPKFKGSRRLIVRIPTLVVEQAGAIRNLRGRAYLPDQLPRNFNETEIR